MSALHIHHYDVEGGTIAYAWNLGPVAKPLVMLHGLGDSAVRTFAPRLDSGLLAGHPTLYIDLPGFGEARYSTDHPATIGRYAADVAALLRSLGTECASLFGHSMGGNVAIHLAHDHPELVERLIVAEPLLDAGHSILAADIARFSEDAFVTRRYSQLVRATSLQALRGDVGAAGFLAPLQLASPAAMHRAARSLIHAAASESAEMLMQLPIPCTVLIGEHTHAATLHLESAKIAIIRIPNAGHNMLVEQAFNTSYAIFEATT